MSEQGGLATPVLAPAKRATVWAPGLPLPIRMPTGKAYVSRIVLWEQIGEGPVPCHWCRRQLSWLPKGSPGGIEADHLDGDFCNDDAANLVPACRRCNTVRGKGMLWLKLRYWRKANHAEIWRWGPIRTEFPCGHRIAKGNIYFARRSRQHECLMCRRERSREWERQHAKGRGRGRPDSPEPEGSGIGETS